MDVISQLQRQFVDYSTTLYREFTQLLKLQDESNPDFVVEAVSLFFEDSDKLINNLAIALEQQPVDFKEVDDHVHQLGSSSSVGAMRVKNVCVAFRSFCDTQNVVGCEMLDTVETRIHYIKEQARPFIHARATDPVSWRVNSYNGINMTLLALLYV